MNDIADFILTVLIAIIPIYSFIKLKKLRYMYFFNLKYIILFYAYFYTLIPAIFLNFTNDIQKWDFTNDIILQVKIYSVYFNIILLTLTLFVKDEKIEVVSEFVPDKISSFFSRIIYFITIIISLVVFLKFYPKLILERSDRIKVGELFFVIERMYKLKGLLFINLCTCSILYWKNQKIYSFVPLILISSIDILSGGRTYLFLAIIFIYINICCKTKKMYLLQMGIVLVTLLSYVTIGRLSHQARLENTNFIGEFIYQSMGEFIQTYNTFPYIIQKNYISSNFLEEITYNLISGILPGFIKAKIGFLDYNIGNSIALEIGRGYGLALNILTETYYYSGVFGLILLPFIIMLLIKCVNKLLLKLNYIGYILLVLIISYLRLVVREGITTYLFTIIYIYILYFNIVFWNKKKIFFRRICE